MSKDNRARPRIHRTDDKHDKALRAYATEHGIEPWRALEIAIQRLAWTDGPTIDTLRADLESAREATRRADAEIERITADWRAALAEVERVKAPKIPRKLMARVKARIKARPNANPPRTFLFVLENGCDRLEASDRYQDKVKRANRIKRAVARMPRKTKRAAKGA